MTSLESLPQSVSIEVPLNVRNPDRALDAVGGPRAIASAVAAPDKRLELRLRKDIFHHPINSTRFAATNIVLEIKLPTWALEKAEGDVQRALALCNGMYTAKPILYVSTAFKFREMADFQYNTQNNTTVAQLQNSVMTGNLPSLMDFEIGHSSPQDLLPPPRFSLVPQPLFYGYKQPSSVAFVRSSDGQLKMINKTATVNLKSHVIKWTEDIPSEPRKDLDQDPRKVTKDCIEELKQLFAVRPSYTRRALLNLVSADTRRALRYALPYVAYTFSSGPWRAAYVKYGENPKTNPQMAKFQVEHFRFANLDEDCKPEDTVYTFDGVNAPTTQMLQLCDISEPFMWSLINECTLRTEPTERDGWFDGGDMRAIRRVLKTELEVVREDRAVIPHEKLQEIADEARAKGESNDVLEEVDEDFEPEDDDDLDDT